VEIRFAYTPGTSPPLPADLTAQVGDHQVTIRTAEPEATLRVLLDWARDHRVSLPGLEVQPPSLEEIYLRLTGGAS